MKTPVASGGLAALLVALLAHSPSLRAQDGPAACVSMDFDSSGTAFVVNACNERLFASWMDEGDCAASPCGFPVGAGRREVVGRLTGQYRLAACEYPTPPRSSDNFLTYRCGTTVYASMTTPSGARAVRQAPAATARAEPTPAAPPKSGAMLPNSPTAASLQTDARCSLGVNEEGNAFICSAPPIRITVICKADGRASGFDMPDVPAKGVAQAEFDAWTAALDRANNSIKSAISRCP